MALTKSFLNTQPKPRVKKADREFSPPDLNLRPAQLRVAEGIYGYIKAQRREFQQERVYASELKSCARKQAFSLMGFTPGPVGEHNPEWSAVADLGTWLHNKVEKWLLQIGGVVNAEFSVRSPDGTLGGRVDAHLADVVLEPAPRKRTWQSEDYQAHISVRGEQYVLDTKTVKDKDFREGAWGQKIPGYIAQISVYGRLLGVTRGIILLVNRNSGEMLDIEFDIDPVYADAMLNRAKSIVEAAKRRQLPVAEEWSGADGSFSCKNFCPFYRQCGVQQTGGSIQSALDSGADPKEL